MSAKKYFDWSSPSFKLKAALFSLWLTIAIALILVRAVILPFLLASLFAYVFHPVVGFLGRIKIRSRPIPRWLSVISIYLIFASAIFLFCAFFMPRFYLEMVRLAKEITILFNSIDEEAINRLGQKIENFFRAYNLPLEIVAPVTNGDRIPPSASRQNWMSIDLLQISNNLLNDVIIYIRSETKNIITSARHVFANLISILFMILLILMITGFLLVDVTRIKGFVFSLVPKANRGQFARFLDRLDQRMSGVVRGQLTICAVNAILTLIGLLIFKVNFAFILATIAGIFSLVPIFGSIASTIPIVLVALTISPMTGFFMLLWIVGIHILEANFLNPKIMGDSANIHPVLIILSLVVGEHFYGIIGALLAVPITSIFITVFLSILDRAHKLDEGVAN